MAKKSAKDEAKAAAVDDDPAAGTPDEAVAAPDPNATQVYMVRLMGPGDDHKIVRTKRNGTIDFYRRAAAQRMRLTSAEVADLTRKGFDVVARATKASTPEEDKG